MRRAGVPASADPVAQLQAHPGMMQEIADVSRAHAMLWHDPEVIADARVANWSAARLPGRATGGFRERIPRSRDADSEQKLDRRVSKYF